MIRRKLIIMSKKITIVLDDDLHKKLRLIHAKEILKTNKYISFSRIVNKFIRNGIMLKK